MWGWGGASALCFFFLAIFLLDYFDHEDFSYVWPYHIHHQLIYIMLVQTYIARFALASAQTLL